MRPFHHRATIKTASSQWKVEITQVGRGKFMLQITHKTFPSIQLNFILSSFESFLLHVFAEFWQKFLGNTEIGELANDVKIFESHVRIAKQIRIFSITAHENKF